MVPEMALRLILDDLGSTREFAIGTLIRSYNHGAYLFPDEAEEGFLHRINVHYASLRRSAGILDNQ